VNKILAGVGVGIVVAGLAALAVFGMKNLGNNIDAKSIEALIKDGKLDEAKVEIDRIAEKKPDAKSIGRYILR